MSTEDRQRYAQAIHGVQTALGWEQHMAHIVDMPSAIDSHLHLRIGVDSCFIGAAAIAELLMEKGVITSDEYDAKLAHYAERELMDFEAQYPGVHFR